VTLRAMLAEERRRERVGEVATAPPSVVATAEPAPVG
jgi:hypothetical protein